MIKFNFFIFSFLLFFSNNVIANSTSSLNPELMQKLGDSLGSALIKSGANELKNTSDGALKDVSKKMFSGIGKGFTSALDGITEEMGHSLKRNFSSESKFSNDLKTVTREMGKNLSTFLDGIGDRLFPFILKYGVTTGITLSLVVTGYYGTKTMYKIIEYQYTNIKPRVVIKSSKDIKWYVRFKRWMFGGSHTCAMVFSPALKQRLNNLVKATKNIATKIKQGKTNIKYRNILLYGPPGTGKTMFSMQLAENSKMEFVLVTGSSFFQPGAGIAAVNELFDWAKKSKYGLCILIDEADSLLSGRDKMDPTSENYRIVNHFLNYLGERSNKFMIVLATNYPTIFDEAMQRRIDDAIEMPLPGIQERFETLCYYRNKILKDVKQNGQKFVDAINICFNDKKINEIAMATDKFSYGDLEGIINTLKSESDITDSGIPNSKLINDVVRYALEKKRAFSKNDTDS